MKRNQLIFATDDRYHDRETDMGEFLSFSRSSDERHQNEENMTHGNRSHLTFKNKTHFVVYDLCINEKTSLRNLINEIERSILIQILKRFNGSQKKAAEFLGIKPSTLCEKLKRYKVRFEKKVE